MPLKQHIEVGPFTFTVIRLLIGIALIRVVIKNEYRNVQLNGMDWLLLIWGAWAVLSVFFWTDVSRHIIFRLGLVYNVWGVYFLFRVFISSLEEVKQILRGTGLLLIPLSVSIINQYVSGYNVFHIVGHYELSQLREYGFRSAGPFAHSILAGSVGAACLPLMISLWQHHKRTAVLGTAAAASMVLCSVSSGPYISALVGIGVMSLYMARYKIRYLMWGGIGALIVVSVMVEGPVYYLIGEMDVTGQSSAWHRVMVIDAAIGHFDEWWLVGTDYTRHWMERSHLSDHIDITNQYIEMGVRGGLFLMVVFTLKLVYGVMYLTKVIKEDEIKDGGYEGMLWGILASLFVHGATMMSVPYFDQSFVFLYLSLATSSSIWSATYRKDDNQGAAKGIRVRV
jgi:hypothetical protein